MTNFSISIHSRNGAGPGENSACGVTNRFVLSVLYMASSLIRCIFCSSQKGKIEGGWILNLPALSPQSTLGFAILFWLVESGAPDRIRTCDLCLRRTRRGVETRINIELFVQH